MKDERVAAEQAIVDGWLGVEPPPSVTEPAGVQAPARAEAASRTRAAGDVALKIGAGDPDDQQEEPDDEGTDTVNATKTKRREQLEMDPNEVLDILLGTRVDSGAISGSTAVVAPPLPPTVVAPPPAPVPAPPAPVMPPTSIPLPPPPPPSFPPGLFAVTPPVQAAEEAPATPPAPVPSAPPGLFTTSGPSAQVVTPGASGQPPSPHIAAPPPPPPPGPALATPPPPPGSEPPPARAPLFYAPPGEADQPLPDSPPPVSAASMVTEILSVTPATAPLYEPDEPESGAITQDLTFLAKRKKRFRLR